MNWQAVSASAPRLPEHERVYRRLRAAVLYGDLAPGQPVTIQGLANELNAGMTPVREALRRLTAEGALVFQGNRRIAVPMLDAPTLADLTDARLALEPMLAERAARSAGPDVVAGLAEIDAALDRAIARGDLTGYLTQNHRFHSVLNAAAEAPILKDLVDGLWLRFGPSLRVVCGQVGTRNLPDRHKELLAALDAQDPRAAATAMGEDVRQGMALIGQAFG